MKVSYMHILLPESFYKFCNSTCGFLEHLRSWYGYYSDTECIKADQHNFYHEVPVVFALLHCD